ncbi:MAG: DNA polymerase II [Nanoarchaeota archaeon]
MKAYIVDADYVNIEEKTQIQLFGRLENGQSFASLHPLTPYFFIRKEDEKKAKKLLKDFFIEDTDFTNFKFEKIIKISAKNQTELNKLPSQLHDLKIDTYEADIKPVQRFLMDNNILSCIEIEGEHESSELIDRVYKNPSIKPAEFKPKLKTISIDIESDKSLNTLFCIGIYGENYQKNFIVSKEKLKNAISCKNEQECLEKFKSELLKQDPDIITGWNMIDFDLVYLKSLFNKHKIPFNIGRTNAEASLRIESNFFRSSTANVPGRQVLDALNLIRDPFIQEAPSIKKAEFDSYTLEDVAQAILKTGKLLKGKQRHQEIEELYKKDQQKLVDYNILDCKLAYDIVKETKMIELAIERTQLTGMQLDKLTASILAFDSLYIREAHKRKLVSPTTHFINKETKIIGGYVKLPEAGIYKNVLVLDFKSLYPSVLNTFNIDPSSFLEKAEKNAIKSPNGAYFKNSDGILPEIIKKLHFAREQAKKEKRELSNYAIKIIMNSFWGVLASPNCRYFNFDMASAITNFARFIIQHTAQEIESQFKVKVIYQDTDSCFIASNLSEKEAEKLGKEIESYINNYYKKYVKDNYNRDSYLELQFEKLYLSLMFPKTREKKDKETFAAKKRYAGLKIVNGKEELEIVGLEAIRGDWTDAAQEFQRELLTKTFHNEPIEKFIKDYIKKINEGKLDSLLVYRKSIRKNLSEYTKTTPPHVKAARLLDTLDSNVIQYYITTNGPEPIQKLKHKLDYEHYIKKQIAPIANQVLSLLGKNFDDLIKGSKQKTLF